MHVTDLTMRDRILRDKVEDVADEGFWKSIGLGALQLGLVMLALFTEGLTLIPALATSGAAVISGAMSSATPKNTHSRRR